VAGLLDCPPEVVHDIGQRLHDSRGESDVRHTRHEAACARACVGACVCVRVCMCECMHVCVCVCTCMHHIQTQADDTSQTRHGARTRYTHIYTRHRQAYTQIKAEPALRSSDQGTHVASLPRQPYTHKNAPDAKAKVRRRPPCLNCVANTSNAPTLRPALLACRDARVA
jgi:hypothetical protein